MLKKCSKCKFVKSIADFNRAINRKDGLQPHCKQCFATYRASNRESLLAQKRSHYKHNQAELLDYKRVAYAQDPDDFKAKSKHRREVVKNDPVLLAKKREYVNAKQNERRLDPEYRMLANARRRTYQALKVQNLRKTKSIIKYLGCTSAFLKEYLASQFRNGMALENYGSVWHIDHIKPCASFDLIDPEQVRECFHYTNLQPLFAEENLRKGARYG